MVSKGTAGCIRAYAHRSNDVSIVDICYTFAEQNQESFDDLISEIARQCTWVEIDKRPSPEEEKRLRELAAVLMELHRLGLLE